MKQITLSALTPTNRIQLGNYLGAVRNWVQMQNEYDCLFFAVDMHAITDKKEKPDPQGLRDSTYQAIATYIAAGLDPEKSTLFVQSHVKEHAELAWILTCHATMGELSRMTQYKDKSQKHGDSIPYGLFAYPVLMAADILLYQAELIPVGADQKQHVELTRDLAIRMNNLYTPGWDKAVNLAGGKSGKSDPNKAGVLQMPTEALFTIPEPWIPPTGARIMSLQDPTKKMSKSDPDPNASVFLTDSDKDIEKKLKRAVTDSGTEITDSPDKPGIRNLLEIQSVITGKPVADLVASYAGKQYGHLKVDTAQIVIETVRPIREEALKLLGDRTHLDAILKRGAEKARARAQKTLTKVVERIGFISAT